MLTLRKCRNGECLKELQDYLKDLTILVSNADSKWEDITVLYTFKTAEYVLSEIDIATDFAFRASAIEQKLVKKLIRYGRKV